MKESRRCFNCGEAGHLSYNCPTKGGAAKEVAAKEKEEKADAKLESKPDSGRKPMKCYTCNALGHGSWQCPQRALFCGAPVDHAATWKGQVEGVLVDDILLDKMLDGEAVTIRCAHGDVALYPLAEVDMKLGGITLKVTAAVSETLPVSVLLGTDVPELGQWLSTDARAVHSTTMEEAMAVTTRAQARRKEEEASAISEAEKKSVAVAHTLEDSGRKDMDPRSSEVTLESERAPSEDDYSCVSEWEGGSSFSDDLFEPPSVPRVKLTRREKREARHAYGLERAQDSSQKHLGVEGVEECGGRAVLQQRQESDVTLTAVRELARDGTEMSESDSGYFRRDGLYYRRWTPAGQEDAAVDQIVLPLEYRHHVLTLAHSIPLSGHFGKKTARCILQPFYWPSLHRDVAAFCRECETCQKSSHRGVARAPMLPLPVVSVPFQRIAMDIVGPLPRNCSGNRYILVLCDYATRYPEAIPLKSIDAGHIAEELVTVFSRVGLPEEILTDQGTNFTSQLLSEIYHLLHIKGLRTSPYHPQTDGFVERFNQTLKSMLRKTATEEGKDWDKLIPYVLFAYSKVPQESTGFSPFELLYGREVRGPLDVLKEEWEASSKSDVSVVSHVLLMREKMEKLAALVKKNVTGSS